MSTRPDSPNDSPQSTRPESARPESARPESARPLSGMQILFASILAIGLLLAISFGNRIAAGQRVQADLEAMNRQIHALETEQAELQGELSYVQSDNYVEEWAREEAKMARPGEVLVVPVPAGVPLPSPTPRPTAPAILLEPEEEADNTWQLWWALFFDSPPP